MKTLNVQQVSSGIAITLLLLLCAGSCVLAGELPDKAKAALEKAFPGVQIRDVEKEKEFGTVYYGIEITHEGKRLEVEVSPDGVLGEVESVIEQKELPDSVSQAVTEQLKDMTIVKIEKHERRGSAKSGAWVPLATPVIFYDVKYKDGDTRKSQIFSASGTQITDLDDTDAQENEHDGEDEDEEVVAVEALPVAVSGAIESQYSGAKLTSATLEKKDDGVSLYEVKFRHQSKNLEAKVDAQGALSKVKEHLSLDKIPAAISLSLKKSYLKATVTEVEKVLAGDKTVYEVELSADDEKIEAVLDESGKILRQKADSNDDEENDHEDKE